ncbi:YidC/Oxa1 family membrane protein insertase [Anaerococcus sp. AGMB09787]|uniref:YidC/Oxa1 family membrane protein insertase n=1 Tax=Anaerococcus sp. AGMB09787 TaxID=2922869 RepID=UPI001FAF4D6E|nr:YidC/Oxa1 family membrane protein insertase [Anaerococcus sp. AGMB09787]
MLNFLAGILGKLMRLIYDFLSANFTEPASISFYAISIIIMTLLVSLLIIPMTISQQKQAEMAETFKPKMEEVKRKYGYDQQIMQQKMQELYKEEGVTPGMSGCLVMIVQLLIMLGLFRMMSDTTKYVFPEGLSHLNTKFFWVPNLIERDPLWYGLPLLTSLSQFAVQLFSMKTNPQMQQSAGAMGSMNTMFLMMPLLYFFLFRSLPAGLPLYYTLSSVFRLIIMVAMHMFGKIKRSESKDEKVNSKNSKNNKRSN